LSLALTSSGLYWECDDGSSIPPAAILFGAFTDRAKAFRLAASSDHMFSLMGDGRVAVAFIDRLRRLSGRRKIALPVRLPPDTEILDVAGQRVLTFSRVTSHVTVASLDGKQRQDVPEGDFLTPSSVVATRPAGGVQKVTVYALSSQSVVHQWAVPVKYVDAADAAGDYAAFVPERGSKPAKYGIYMLRLATGDVAFTRISRVIDEVKVGPDGVYYVQNVRGRSTIYALAFPNS